MDKIEDKAKRPDKKDKRPSRKQTGASRALNRPERLAMVFGGKLAPYARYVTPGFVGRWVLSEPDKMERRKLMGYRTVLKQDEDGSAESPIVRTQNDGTKLVLMELSKEFAEEYREYAAQRIDDQEEAIKGKTLNSSVDGLKMYEPDVD